jgi:hypothetical protein
LLLYVLAHFFLVPTDRRNEISTCPEIFSHKVATSGPESSVAADKTAQSVWCPDGQIKPGDVPHVYRSPPLNQRMVNPVKVGNLPKFSKKIYDYRTHNVVHCRTISL